MMAVIQKAWADLRVRYWQSALILLSVGAAATLLYLGLASLLAASSPYETQMARANGAHAWFYLPTDADGRAAAERLAARPEVAGSIQRPTLRAYLAEAEAARVPWLDVIPLPPGRPDQMGYVLLEGRDLQSGDRDGGLVTVSLARYLDLGTGDAMRVQTLDGPRAIRIIGLIADPKTCTFPRCNPQSLYVLEETYLSLAVPPEEQALLLGVWLKDPEAADSFVSRVRAAEAGLLREASNWLLKQDFYRQDRLFNVVPVLLFGIVAVAAVAMILANIIGGAVLGQFREIAVLKSLGFTGGQVLLLYMSQTVVLGLLGGGLGVVGGHLLTVAAMRPLAHSMGTPDVLGFLPAVAGAVLGIVLAVAALFAALAAWRAVLLRPAAMLAEGFAAPQARVPWVVRILAALRLPAPVLLGVKDAVARPARAAMTVISLIVCLVTIILSLNFPAIADEIMANRELIGINWDVIVQPKQLSLAEAEEVVAALPDLEGYYREVYLGGTVVEQEFDLGVRAVDGDYHRFGFRVLEGRLPEQPGEILLAPRAWERLGASLGDELRLQVGGQGLVVTVVGRYQDQINNGRMALMTFATLDRLGPAKEQGLPLLRVKLKPEADWMAAHRALLEGTDYRALVFLEERELPDFARDVVEMTRLLARAMAGIAGLSIMGAALLTAREQMREVGIRKAIGMTPAQVLGSVTAGGAWFGLVAVAVALPGGYLLQRGVTAVMAGVMGLAGMPLALSGGVLLLAGAVGMALAVAAVMPAAVWGARQVTARVLQAE